MSRQKLGILFLLPAILGLAGSFLAGVTGCSSTAPAAPVSVTTIFVNPTATPVCASPTTRGTTSTGTSDGYISAPQLTGNPVTLATATTAVSISFETGLTYGTAPQGRFAIYGDNGSNQPGNLVAQTSLVTMTANSWNSFPLTSPVYLPAGTYWIISLFPVDESVHFNSSGGNYIYVTYAWSEMPTTFPLGGSGTGGALLSQYFSACP